MPSTERLISQAVEWTDKQLPAQQDDNAGVEPAQRHTVDEVRAAIPRPGRVAAIERVRDATFAGETDAQRCNREQREVQLEKARWAELYYQQDQEDAVAIEAANQALSPPAQEMNGWTTSREVCNLQSIMSWIDLVRVVTVTTSKSLCTEQPDSSTLCTQKRSHGKGLMLLSRHCKYIIHSTKIPLLNRSKLAGVTTKPGPAWFS
jgi:hypothetical protein